MKSHIFPCLCLALSLCHVAYQPDRADPALLEGASDAGDATLVYASWYREPYTLKPVDPDFLQVALYRDGTLIRSTPDDREGVLDVEKGVLCSADLREAQRLLANCEPWFKTVADKNSPDDVPYWGIYVSIGDVVSRFGFTSWIYPVPPREYLVLRDFLGSVALIDSTFVSREECFGIRSFCIKSYESEPPVFNHQEGLWDEVESVEE